uniref:Uncharacterized protein n=1 Tax=Anguilla anguilla TaxID=7936 RepID=A0A0E9QX34_ANGAN
MGKPKKKSNLSRAELMMMTIADVIKQLVEAHEEGKDVNLNKSVFLTALQSLNIKKKNSGSGQILAVLTLDN